MFAAALNLTLMEHPDGQPDTEGGRAQWFVSSDLAYTTKAGELIVVPAGATTDLASIPRLVSALLPPDGPWIKAAVLHDHLYRTKGLAGRFTRGQCDAIFSEAMKAQGVAAWKRALIFGAVRGGGWIGWGK